MNVRRRPLPPRVTPLAHEFLDAVLRIERATFETPWSKAVFLHEIVEPRSHFSCLLLEDACIGYGGYWHVVDEMHISNIAIAQAHRRQGYGAWLLAAMLRDAVARGMGQATLEVREHNDPARAMYHAFGFAVAGRRPGYYAEEGEDALLMWNYDIGATVAALPPDLGIDAAG